jgi:hypothetical protein
MDQLETVLDQVKDIPIEQLDRARVRDIVRAQGTTQHGRSPIS